MTLPCMQQKINLPEVGFHARNGVITQPDNKELKISVAK